ncbi:TonB family protein [Lysobacter sp. KIS68-7]|uniref:energy transducer TonB n=1 Tax=Lysobacter sp. KIS68-7 TaxID=2904252 RepID=UPI001E4B5514|nr:energy transducer TonB [Lysobacter sp. KIS68-7]UHQ19456.1 TonB family protein [Lysobacter sp. KIS68-7]
MVHATLRSFPQAQLGVLRERPSPARIAAISAVVALHAAAFVLLLMPMAAPEPAPARDEVIPVTSIIRKIPPVLPVAPPRDPRPPTHTVVTTRQVVQTPPDPPILVEESTDVVPPTPPAREEVTSITPTAGPLRMERLEYATATPPPYPPEAQRRRIEGTVLLQVLVDVDGKPIQVTIQQSSGNRTLDEAAVRHVLKRWMFRPAIQNGVAVQAIGLVPIKFTVR